jgi:flavin-dependent dehydrogenase
LLSENLPTSYLAVGDAVCSFDPISSMGIGFALASGSQAATAINASDHTSGDMSLQSYFKDTKRIFSDYLKTRNKIYRQETRWPDSDFWQRRTGEIFAEGYG